jgi:hypothetical protein
MILYVNAHCIAYKTVIFVDTEILLALSSVIQFFTSASRSDHFVIWVWKECLFISEFRSSFLCHNMWNSCLFAVHSIGLKKFIFNLTRYQCPLHRNSCYWTSYKDESCATATVVRTTNTRFTISVNGILMHLWTIRCRGTSWVRKCFK